MPTITRTATFDFPLPDGDCGCECDGVESPCCTLEGVTIPNVLYARFSGSLIGDVTLTYDPAIINAAGTGTWVGTFTANSHEVTVWWYCVPSLSTWAVKTFCDVDVNAYVAGMYAAFGSSAPGPPYDVFYDMYPVGSPDGTIDSLDLFYFYNTFLENQDFGAGGTFAGTHCPNHSGTITRTMGGGTNACVPVTGDFTIEVQEYPFP